MYQYAAHLLAINVSEGRVHCKDYRMAGHGQKWPVWSDNNYFYQTSYGHFVENGINKPVIYGFADWKWEAQN